MCIRAKGLTLLRFADYLREKRTLLSIMAAGVVTVAALVLLSVLIFTR